MASHDNKVKYSVINNRIPLVLNALLIWILCGVLISAFGVQVFLHEQPCPLCLLQRIGMTAAAFGAFLNIYFGCRPSHFALILLAVVFGGMVALRQIALHVCPGDPLFGTPVLGLSLYVWSFIVFVCTTAFTALLLFLYNPHQEGSLPHTSLFFKTTAGLLVGVTLLNLLTTLQLCGLGPCID